jgi:hypothetical protein
MKLDIIYTIYIRSAETTKKWLKETTYLSKGSKAICGAASIGDNVKI